MTIYCMPEQVAAQTMRWPVFTEDTTPTRSLVERWIGDVSAEIDAALATGGHYELPITQRESPICWAWLSMVCQLEVVSRLPSHFPIGDYDAKLALLRGGGIAWPDKAVRASTETVAPFRQRFE